MVKLSAWLAIVVGVLIAGAQLVRNFDNWANWPTWMIDEVVAVLLIAAGVMTLRGSARLLTVAWAFASGLYASAVLSHINSLERVGSEIYAEQQQITVAIAISLVLSLVGFALAFFARKRA